MTSVLREGGFLLSFALWCSFFVCLFFLFFPKHQDIGMEKFFHSWYDTLLREKKKNQKQILSDQLFSRVLGYSSSSWIVKEISSECQIDKVHYLSLQWRLSFPHEIISVSLPVIFLPVQCPWAQLVPQGLLRFAASCFYFTGACGFQAGQLDET